MQSRMTRVHIYDAVKKLKRGFDYSSFWAAKKTSITTNESLARQTIC